LFFAGVLPQAIANGVRAQVVYMTNHYDNKVRETERLDGLYAVGVRNLPIVPDFPDQYSESLAEAERGYERAGFTKEDFIIYCVENIRRFRPQVVVGHDIDGEYGHGGHMLASVSLMEAVELAGDENFHPESAEIYGVWDPPKTYIHLWQDRPVRLDIDSPLDYFDGKTAFEVSQYGFSFHKSQRQTWLGEWLNGSEDSPITLSTQIKRYAPGKFGLYRTTVGGDPEGAADFYANVILTKDIPAEKPEVEEVMITLGQYIEALPPASTETDDKDGEDAENGSHEIIENDSDIYEPDSEIPLALDMADTVPAARPAAGPLPPAFFIVAGVAGGGFVLLFINSLIKLIKRKKHA
jgi:LmbE family N-acetylglucosaminyl deacetylase